MRCPESERAIHLYNELATHERDELDRHISACSECRRIFERVRHDHAMVLETLKVPRRVPNHSSLISRIMQGVNDLQKERPSFFETLSYLLLSNRLRYTMLALTVFMIGAFVMESARYPQEARQMQMGLQGEDVANLDSPSFYEAFRTMKERTETPIQSIYKCAMICLQSTQPACDDCQAKLSNLNLTQ